MLKNELEIQSKLLKDIAKDYEKKIKVTQLELEKTKEYYKGFSVRISGQDESLSLIQNSIDIYISEKIRFEKWSKKLKHQIGEL